MWNAIEYDKRYLNEMLKMTVEQYGAENDIADQNFLMHEYFENPAGDAVISLAYDDAQMTIAGQYIIWPMHFMVGNNKIKCAHSLNTLTSFKRAAATDFVMDFFLLEKKRLSFQREIGRASCRERV